MSVAFELEFEACRPRLYALSDQPARTAPTPQVRRRRVVLVAVVLGLLVLLALPVRAFGGSTLAQAPPSPGQVYVVKSGDTLASIAELFKTSVASLRTWNPKLPGSKITPGQRLTVYRLTN